jgi:hypothetical protein
LQQESQREPYLTVKTKMSNKDMYYNMIRANFPENEVIERAQGRRSRSENCMDPWISPTSGQN